MTLALHVLIAGGLGKSYSFAGGVATLAAGHSMSYRDALKIILQNILSAIILGSLPPIPSIILPNKLQDIKLAVAEFKTHMNEMVEEERTRVDKLDSEKDNLLTALVRASDQGRGRSSLSHDEIMGNLFIYNVAGHDTTANTICYAIYLLAADPHWQEWIGEEIRSVFAGKDDVESWEYEKAFPKLKRCLALMVSRWLIAGPLLVLTATVRNSPSLRPHCLHPAVHWCGISNPKDKGNRAHASTEDIHNPQLGLAEHHAQDLGFRFHDLPTRTLARQGRRKVRFRTRRDQVHSSGLYSMGHRAQIMPREEVRSS
jgi:hypothetical protein